MGGILLELRSTPYDDPVVRRLEARVQEEYVRLYGGPDATETDPGQFAPPDGVFLVGWAGPEPVATGGLRRHDQEAAEIKRMYVLEAYRGMGYARAVLAALEAHAAAAGYRRILLETGTMQPAAIALYESSGYAPAQGFGHYQHSPLSRSFTKSVPRAPD
jgi:GNAT superfamily N-acetyltransferase